MCVVVTPGFHALGPRLVLTVRVPSVVPLEAIPLSTTNNPIPPPILQETSGFYLGVHDRYMRLTSHFLVLSKSGILFCKETKAFRGLFWQSCGFPLPRVLWTCWGRYILRCSAINLLKRTGHVMHQQFNIQQLYALPTPYLCVLYLSEDKQRLVPLTA